MGEELHEIIQKIILSAPEQPPGTAPELVRLVRKAMRPEPSDRIPTARALRRSVRDFMRHQGSRRLESEAVAREAELEAQLATLGESPTRAEFTEVDRLYAECRFGYRTAVEAWPENPTAGGSLESLSVRMANFYISRHEPALAASVLSGVPNPPAELQRQVAEAAAAEDARKEQLEALDRDMSLDTGSRTRTFLAFCLGLLWTIGPLLRPALAAQDPDGYYGLILLPTAFMCIGTGAAIWARESMTASRLNRFILATLTVVFTAELFFAMAAWRLGIPAAQTLSLTFLFWALAAAMIGIGADVRIAPTAFAYVAGFFLSLQLPAYRYYITSACNAFTTLYTVLVWAPPDFLRRRVSSLGWRGDIEA